MKKILIYGLIAGLVIALIVFLYVFRKADTGGISKKADYIISVDSLLTLYTANEDSANKLFLDKIIQVKGEVAEISQDSTRFTVVLRNPDAMEGVSCSLGDDQSGEVKKLVKGKIIEIKGICAGKLSDVALNKCSIIEE
jgi:hypothetical protein